MLIPKGKCEYVRSWKILSLVMVLLTTYSLVVTYLLYIRMSLNVTPSGISLTPILSLFRRHSGLLWQQSKLDHERISKLLSKTPTDVEKITAVKEVGNNKQLQNVRNNKLLQKDRTDRQLQEVRNDTRKIGNNKQLKEVINNKQLQEVKNDNQSSYFQDDKQLTVVGNGSFYIYTIHAHQTVPGTKWDKLFVTGWELEASLQRKYICCLKYENGTREKAFSANKHSWNKGSPLQARLVVCSSSSSAIEARPKWATLILTSDSCEDTPKFQEVVYRLPENVPSVAICGKIAYGTKNPLYLVEWVEYHKYLGVSKIVIYPYSDLNKIARKVLEYYVKEGIMETVVMPTVPLLEKYPRHFSVRENMIEWQDEKVPLFDIEQRLRPYQYYGVIDTDEFIVPKQRGVKTLLQLMDNLLRKYPDGGTFKMMSAIHILDWDKTNQTSDLMIEQYGRHTVYIDHTAKLLHVTNRMKEGAIWVHNAVTKPGYKMIFPSPKDDVAYKHFRECPEKWLQQNRSECVNGFKGQRDKVLEEVAKIIGPRIRHVMEFLGV